MKILAFFEEDDHTINIDNGYQKIKMKGHTQNKEREQTAINRVLFAGNMQTDAPKFCTDKLQTQYYQRLVGNDKMSITLYTSPNMDTITYSTFLIIKNGIIIADYAIMKDAISRYNKENNQ